MRTLFVILARGGSKRLPRKNLRQIGGVPLIGRAVRTARGAAHHLTHGARVIVSTDDEAIAAVARRWGAETPFIRPAGLATDNAASVDALRHAVDRLSAQGEHFGEVVLLQPTSPLTAPGDVIAAIKLFRQHPASSVVSVREHPHGRDGVNYKLVDGILHARETGSSRGIAVELNGAIYVCSPEWLARHKNLVMPGETRALMMLSERSIDVDTEADLRMARTLWEQGLPWPEGRCLIIAEAGVNHNGSLDTARRLVDVAQSCGADAVKFQTFAADRLVAKTARKEAYQQAATPRDEPQHEMLRRLELSPDDHRQLLAHCQRSGILFLSSAFSEEDVDLLDELDVRAIKIGSGEITDLPLLRRAGATLRPMILSTGCSTIQEVADALVALRESGGTDVALLHCVSSYPADPADVNLRAMSTLHLAFGVPVGYSDHTPGVEVAVAAAALGARIIEKHFTLDRTMPGPDHQASLEPGELTQLTRAIRSVEAALGNGIKVPAESEADVRIAARKSLVARVALAAGTVLERSHLDGKRPGTGLPPRYMEAVIGRKLARELAADEPLTWAHFAGDMP